MGTSTDIYDNESVRLRLTTLKQRKIDILRSEMLQWYSPHSAQIAFHRSLAKIRGLFGGNQSGKSLAGAVEIAFTVGKVHPWRANEIGPVFARDCCVDFAHVQQVLLPTYRKLLPPYPCKLPGVTHEGKERYWPGLLNNDFDKAYSAVDKVLHFADGGVVEFKSYDQGWQKFGGSQRHITRMDEEPDEPIYNENLARQTIYQTNIIVTMTPLQYSQWLYNRIFEAAAGDTDIAAFQMSSYDNPHANKDVLDKMAESISDPAEREARLFGTFTFLAGRVYKEYGDHNRLDHFLIHDDWEKTIIIDPHLEKKTAVNWIARDPDNQKGYIYREADLSGTIKEICDEIISLNAGDHIELIIVDPSSKQKSKLDGRGAIIDEIRKYLPGAVLANNAVDKGVDRVRQLVKNRPGGPLLYCLRSCPITDHQLSNYSWKPPTATGEDRSKAQVVKRDDDHCDCVRYWAMHNPPLRTVTFGGFDMEVYANG